MVVTWKDAETDLNVSLELCDHLSALSTVCLLNYDGRRSTWTTTTLYRQTDR